MYAGGGDPSIVTFDPDDLQNGSGPVVFVADVDVFSYNGAAFNETLIKNIFAYVAGMSTLGSVTLTATPTQTEAGAGAVPIDVIPLSLFTDSATGPEGAPLSAIPLSAIGLKDSPLSAIPLSAIPLSAITTGPTSTPLSAILLSDIPLSAIGGWDEVLVGSSLAGAIPQNTTLQDVVDSAPEVLDDIDLGSSEIASTLLGEVDIFEFLFAGDIHEDPESVRFVPSTVPMHLR